ncbi:amidohydrolase family protein [Ihubacter sp. rT4E-8]|uniref:amidohydrolase family protein n=1 Tax=Ihubacter sp. rT4E-8 TaxID=3242369 RepID=UPI003CF23450
MYDLVIYGGMIVDGTGQKQFAADIAIQGGRIMEIGEPSSLEGQSYLQADGQFVCPGFIDMHSHADLTVFLYPDCESLIGQGVTTVFCGHCGMGMAPFDRYFMPMYLDRYGEEAEMPLSTLTCFPGQYPPVDTETMKKGTKKHFGLEISWKTFAEYRDYLREQGTGINMLMLLGHSNVRQSVMGLDTARKATEQEVAEMEQMVKEAMEAGAFGLSFGFDYAPGWDASEEELLRLAACLKPYDGILTAHVQMGGRRRGEQHADHRVIASFWKLEERLVYGYM